MSWTLNDLQAYIANEVDQSSSTPDTGGTDWSLRTSFLNRAQRDWAETYEWNALLKVHNGFISTSTGNASYALPADFKKIDGFPIVGGNEFVVDSPSSNRQYLDSDYFVNILGNESSGHVMYIHNADSALSSGASVQFTYFATPTGLSTTTSVSPCPDPNFLVQRALYYLYKGREDARFPEAKAEADKILARMVENENTKGISNVDKNVRTTGRIHYNFRIGRD